MTCNFNYFKYQYWRTSQGHSQSHTL